MYYYGARYLDPKYSMWLSTDPALGEYIPQAPINDELRKNNQNLLGMGGIFNHINSNLYHYAVNNPVKYIDPDGRANIYFIFTFGKDDDCMLAGEFWSQLSTFKNAIVSGMSIKIIIHGTQDDILKAIQDPECYALITSGHGSSKGEICTASGSWFNPKSIDKEKLSSNLKLVIFENCYQGTFEEEWEEAFGGNVDVVGWSGETNTFETISFNTFGFFDRQKKNMSNYLFTIKKAVWIDRIQTAYNKVFNKKSEDNSNE